MRERKSNLIIRSIVINPAEGCIPYRLSDWKEFCKEKCMYVDQTEAIAKLDKDTIYSSIWSPQRTGKSLLCHQLELWHDKAILKEERQELFSGTYIGKNPTYDAGKYLVLKLNFSSVDETNLEESFNEVINSSISKFSEKYHKAGLLDNPVEIDDKDCMSSFSDLASEARLSNQKLSLIVDDVDAFNNRLLMKVIAEKGLNKAGYEEFRKREGSTLRHFGRVLKSASKSCLYRIFFTGVLPVRWADGFSSSLDIVYDRTHTNSFQDTFGFKSSDIEELLTTMFPHLSAKDKKQHLKQIQEKSNGHKRYPDQKNIMYNPQGVWFYLKQLQDKGELMQPSMDPDIKNLQNDEIIAFLVKHAAAMPEYSPIDYYTSAIPHPHFHGFFPDLIFSHSYGPSALLSLAHYFGYLTYEHPLQEEYGPRLVAPTAQIKDMFIEAVLSSMKSTSW